LLTLGAEQESSAQEARLNFCRLRRLGIALLPPNAANHLILEGLFFRFWATAPQALFLHLRGPYAVAGCCQISRTHCMML
jgi:hypothetical protein